MDTVEQTLAGTGPCGSTCCPASQSSCTRRSHWGKLMEPALTTFVAFVVVAWLVEVAFPGRRTTPSGCGGCR